MKGLSSSISNVWRQLQTLDMQNPGQWSAFIKAVFFCGVFTVLVMLFWLLLLNSKAAQLDTAKIQTQTLEQEYQKKMAQIADIDANRATFANQQKMHAYQLARLPIKVNAHFQIQQLTTLANTSGNMVNNISLGTLSEQGQFLQQSINMQITGQYKNITVFLSGLQSLQHIITIQEFDIKPLTDLLMARQVNDGNNVNLSNPKLQLNLLLVTHSVNTSGAKVNEALTHNYNNNDQYMNTAPVLLPANPFALPKALRLFFSSINSNDTQLVNTKAKSQQAVTEAFLKQAEPKPSAKLSDDMSHQDNEASLNAYEDNPTSLSESSLQPPKLDVFQFKGLVVAPSGTPFALIERSDGVLLQVKKGEYLPTNTGKVIAITASQLTVEETMVVNDKKQTRQRVLSVMK